MLRKNLMVNVMVKKDEEAVSAKTDFIWENNVATDRV